jgi:hypothetical protein
VRLLSDSDAESHILEALHGDQVRAEDHTQTERVAGIALSIEGRRSSKQRRQSESGEQNSDQLSVAFIAARRWGVKSRRSETNVDLRDARGAVAGRALTATSTNITTSRQRESAAGTKSLRRSAVAITRLIP